jgi:hypothetical protein
MNTSDICIFELSASVSTGTQRFKAEFGNAVTFLHRLSEQKLSLLLGHIERQISN